MVYMERYSLYKQSSSGSSLVIFKSVKTLWDQEIEDYCKSIQPYIESTARVWPKVSPLLTLPGRATSIYKSFFLSGVFLTYKTLIVIVIYVLPFRNTNYPHQLFIILCQSSLSSILFTFLVFYSVDFKLL